MSTLTASTVSQVLTSLVSGLIKPEAAQKWAESTATSGVDYEPQHEDAIDDAIRALRNLGDAVGGKITPEMAAQMVQALGGRSQSAGV